MKTILKRVLFILCFFSSLSFLSFVDFDASSLNIKNEIFGMNSDRNFDFNQQLSSKINFNKTNADGISFSGIQLDHDVLKISLLDQKPTSIQIFNLDGTTAWYEFFTQRTYIIRPNLSKGVYIARLFQGEKYNTMTFTVH